MFAKFNLKILGLKRIYKKSVLVGLIASWLLPANAERYLAGLTSKDISRIAEDSFNQRDSEKHQVKEVKTKSSSQLRIVSSPQPLNAKTISDKKQRGPASVKPRNFTIQVGAYESLLEAQEQIRNYSKIGLSAFQTTGLVKGKKWFRVNLGVYPTQKAAQTQLDKYKTDRIMGFVRSF